MLHVHFGGDIEHDSVPNNPAPRLNLGFAVVAEPFLRPLDSADAELAEPTAACGRRVVAGLPENLQILGQTKFQMAFSSLIPAAGSIPNRSRAPWLI